MKSDNVQVLFPARPHCSRQGIPICSLLLMIVVSGCSTEPVWQGKPLSVWLGDLNNLDRERADAAETAINHIGTNAVPYLVPRLTSAETSVAEWLETGGRPDAHQTGAVLAFRILGSSAAQSLPALGVLLTNQTAVTNLGIAYAVAQSMAGIGEQAKPQLVAALNNPSPNVRRASLVGLIDLDKKARDAIPAVMERLKDGDAEVRGLAVFFLSEVAEELEVKLRVLKEASQDSNRSVRSFAEKELSKFELK